MMNKIRKWKRKLLYAAIWSLISGYIAANASGCNIFYADEPVEEGLSDADKALFGTDASKAGESNNAYVGKALKEFIAGVGENYTTVNGDTVRTPNYKVTIDRTNGDRMEECIVTSVSAITEYREYEGITYKEYVHLTNDRDIVRVNTVGNKEKSAYVETGDGMVLYFESGVSQSFQVGSETSDLYDIVITTCTD